MEKLNEDEIGCLYQYEAAAKTLERDWEGFNHIRDFALSKTDQEALKYLDMVYNDYKYFFNRANNETQYITLKGAQAHIRLVAKIL